METVKNFPYQAVTFDRKGKVTGGLADLVQFLGKEPVTDLIVMCHGFRNDAADATNLYSEFLGNLGPQLKHATLRAALGSRKFAVAGALWPSMVFNEKGKEGRALSAAGASAEEKRLRELKKELPRAQQHHIDAMLKQLPQALLNNESAQQAMAQSLLDLAADIGGGLTAEFSNALEKGKASTLVRAFSFGDQAPVAAPTGGARGVGIPTLGPRAGGGTGSAQSVFGKVFGFVPKFVNLTTFLPMFERCGTIGEAGLTRIVRDAKKAKPALCASISSVTASADAPSPPVPRASSRTPIDVESMLLLQAAYSHFGFSPGKGGRKRGFFRDIIEKQVVKQPILATHSRHDSVVGFAYTSMAALSLNNSKAIGDENSRFGGVGRNGVLDTPETAGLDLKLAGEPYSFVPGKLYNLDGSRAVNGCEPHQGPRRRPQQAHHLVLRLAFGDELDLSHRDGGGGHHLVLFPSAEVGGVHDGVEWMSRPPPVWSTTMAAGSESGLKPPRPLNPEAVGLW
jgi:hypothetical protein